MISRCRARTHEAPPAARHPLATQPPLQTPASTDRPHISKLAGTLDGKMMAEAPQGIPEIR